MVVGNVISRPEWGIYIWYIYMQGVVKFRALPLAMVFCSCQWSSSRLCAQARQSFGFSNINLCYLTPSIFP